MPPPERPALLYKPKSGGGKTERFSLAEEARARGIEPIELGPGADREHLARNAVADGADALATAGGDGSQGIVAEIPSELGLPTPASPETTRVFSGSPPIHAGIDGEAVTLDAPLRFRIRPGRVLPGAGQPPTAWLRCWVLPRSHRGALPDRRRRGALCG